MSTELERVSELVAPIASDLELDVYDVEGRSARGRPCQAGREERDPDDAHQRVAASRPSSTWRSASSLSRPASAR